MKPVVGVFKSSADAERGVERVRSVGVDRDKINILMPGSSDRQVAQVPVSDTEQPGMGAAVGSLVGGSVGAAGGFGAGAALASLLVPGVGPILAGGLLGARRWRIAFRVFRTMSCMFTKMRYALAAAS
jgi:uncharacterized protein YcfJ